MTYKMNILLSEADACVLVRANLFWILTPGVTAVHWWCKKDYYITPDSSEVLLTTFVPWKYLFLRVISADFLIDYCMFTYPFINEETFTTDRVWYMCNEGARHIYQQYPWLSGTEE